MRAPVALLALSLLIPATLAPGAPQGGHKIQLEYLAYPDTTFVNTERRIDVCLVNHGQDGEVIHDGDKDLDQVVLSIPVGSLDDDLTEEPMLLYCLSPEPDWLCLGPELQGDDALLTFRPDGAVPLASGQTLCFRVVMLNVNPEVGLTFLDLDQQIDSKRAMPPLNDWMAVFKTDLPAIKHDDLAEVRSDQHHPRYTDDEASAAVLDRDGHGSALDAHLLVGLGSTDFWQKTNVFGGDVSGPGDDLHLGARVVGTQELANGAVTASKIGSDAVTTDKIKDREAGSDDLADKSVTMSSPDEICVRG